MESARSCCRPKQRASLRSILLSFIESLVPELKYDIGTKQQVPNLILCKAADLSRQPVWGKGVCSDSNQTAQQLQMAARKSFETMSGVILNRSRPRFAAKSLRNEMRCLKAMYLPASTGRASIFNLKIFWAIWLVLLTNHPYFDLEDLS